jgi:hypothetical protein
MGSARGALSGGSGFEGLWPTEQHAAEIFFAVAKLYAQDIGIPSQKLTTDEWKAAVAKSLEAKARERAAESGADIEEAVAFVAGAYVRWGTPTGFRSSGDQTGYAIARRISSLNEFSVQLLHQPGYPGATTVTVSDGGETPKEEFFRLMHQVEQAVRKEPIQPPQRNAGSRPSSGDSPASRNPSSLGPRG